MQKKEYYISVPIIFPSENKEVKNLKPIKFKEIPEFNFVVFQEIDTKNWKIIEVETGINVITKSSLNKIKTFMVKNAECIITALNNVKNKPVVSHKKIPLINKEPQPTGAKLCKTLTYNGIKKKFLVKYKEVHGITFYTLLNKQQSYDYIFIETNNHFVNVGSVCNCENIANRIIKENVNIHQWIEDNFTNSLNSNQRVSLGFAEYLGRMEEALEHNRKVYEQAQERQKQREEDKKRKEEQRQKEEQQKLMLAEQEFKNNGKITGEMFVKLCDKYNIKLPLRTRGWCLNSLVNINKDSCNYYGNKSTTIWNYVKELTEKLSA